MEFFNVDPPAGICIAHVLCDGEDLQIRQAELDDLLFMQVMSGREPVYAADKKTLHVSVSIRYKDGNKIARQPTKEETAEVVRLFGKEFKEEEDGRLVHLWEKE